LNLASRGLVPDATATTGAAVVLAALLLCTACTSQQATIQQQQEKLESLAASTELIAQSWLDGHTSQTYAVTAFDAMLAQVEQQRAVLAAKPAILVDRQGSALSQQAEQLSRLIAQMQHDVEARDSRTLRGRLPSIPLLPAAK